MAAISLTRSASGVTGLVGDEHVDLRFESSGRGRVRGESFGARVDGHWRIESNYENPDPVGLFLGEYDGLPVFLRSDVHLGPSYSLRHADITGTIGDRDVQVRAAPVDVAGDLVVGFDGHIDGKSLSLFATTSCDIVSGGQVTGVIGGRHLKIEATRTTVTGEYDAAPPLFPLLVCALLHFV